MILITGAGGKTGKTVIQALSTLESVCAFVHTEQQVSGATSAGAQTVIAGDMRDPDAVHAAMAGARAVYHICPNMNADELLIGNMVIGVARDMHVQHFVYHSVLHPQTEKMTHHWQKLRVEELLIESGLPFTILQPAPYMQNLLPAGSSIFDDGVLQVPYSVNSKFSFVDLNDVAAAAAAVFTEANHLHASYELVGTPPLSHAEIAEMLRGLVGRDIVAVQEKIADWKKRNSALSKYAMQNLLRMFDYYAKWGLSGNPNVLRWLLKREPTSLDMFFARTIGERGGGRASSAAP